MFLTRIPTPPVAHSDRLLALSAAYFPLVGLIIGGLGAITYSIALAMWNPEIAVVLTLGVMIYATGGFHEDGLADTSDGIGGGWSTEDKLQIMKDSRIGTYGSLALVLALLVKYTTLLAITPESIATALICGHVLARWSILPLLHSSHYVGSSEGSGKPLVGEISGKRSMVASAVMLIVLLGLAGTTMFAVFAAALVIIGLARWYLTRKIGGVTGDTLGAVNQVVELSVYLVFAALVS